MQLLELPHWGCSLLPVKRCFGKFIMLSQLEKCSYALLARACVTCVFIGTIRYLGGSSGAISPKVRDCGDNWLLFILLCTKTYIVHTLWNCLNEAVPNSMNNI